MTDIPVGSLEGFPGAHPDDSEHAEGPDRDTETATDAELAYPLAGRIVLVAGATNVSGVATASALVAAGATVVAVGSNRERLAGLGEQVPDTARYLCDLTDVAAVDGLAGRVRREIGRIDGLVHLVGGWRGGGGISSQSEEDWEFLSGSLTALRLTSRAFYDDLAASEAGRLAIVSSTTVAHPTAGSASYTAVKAASEAWTLAVADGFAHDERGSAAAVIFVVTGLAGLENDLATRIVRLWQTPARDLNGARIPLDPIP